MRPKQKGKEHAILDALSRLPVADPSADDEASAGDLSSSAHHHLIRRVRSICRATGETDEDVDDTAGPPPGSGTRGNT
ncbi:hypothetical protein OUZ56_011773 [Daphnia magna]|uniref:Uncharacterized protein n=1 Tax=Daphnia magna TaxID=35525 RepID=A0ABQ9Z140_9CRUS|nr:hypothetical protein OUZ56_011773 [Daphnia magna]